MVQRAVRISEVVITEGKKQFCMFLHIPEFIEMEGYFVNIQWGCRSAVH